MAKKLVLPTEKTVIAQGVNDLISCYYGPPGVGKTTFGNGLGKKVFFISTDRGTRNQFSLRQEASTWKRALKILEALEEDDAPHYDFIAIDHVSDWANMCEDYVCDKLGVESLSDETLAWGKGWKDFKSELKSFIGRVLALNSGIIFIAQEVVKKIKTRGVELDRTQPDLGKTSWNILIPICDIVGYCGIKNVKKEGGGRQEVRYITTEPTETTYAKDRSRRVKPDKGKREPLDPEMFLATFEKETDNGNEKQEATRGRRGHRRSRN